MRRKVLAIVAPLMLLNVSAHAGNEAAAGKAIFDSACAECHYADDFAGESKADIKAMITEVASGKVDHKGDLSGLSEDEMAKVAAFFASAE